jgi:ABC-2 type transport system ATP-binding protein
MNDLRTVVSNMQLEATKLCTEPDLLRVTNVSKQFAGRFVLDRVSLLVNQGEVLGLIGPNGAGKTTLLEVIAGLLPAEVNQVLWRGRPLPSPRRREILFYLPDGVRPYQDQLVWHVLKFFAEVYRAPLLEIMTTVASLRLEPVLQQRVHTLSKGYNRRLILALGLITPHPLLLMDEPFDGFDLRQAHEVIGVLRRTAAEGRTLILAIHQLNDAEKVCDRFALISNGCVCGSGTLSDLRARTNLPEGKLEEIFLALT